MASRVNGMDEFELYKAIEHAENEIRELKEQIDFYKSALKLIQFEDESEDD